MVWNHQRCIVQKGLGKNIKKLEVWVFYMEKDLWDEVSEVSG